MVDLGKLLCFLAQNPALNLAKKNNPMVCAKCVKAGSSSSTIITPETWKDGKKDSRKINENKLLGSKAKQKFSPYAQNCLSCKKRVHNKGAKYCQKCAYDKALCSQCGVKMLDISKYNQSKV
jgi:hypothetical protein